MWTIDEGLSGIDVHVANDGLQPLRARLRVALYRDREVAVGEAVRELEVPAHGAHVDNVEEMLGHFVDVSWSYRFGPPAQDVVVASLERSGGGGEELLGQAFRLPAGRPLARETASALGLEASLEPGAGGQPLLSVRARRFVYGARVDVPGFVPADDAFCVEPGGERRIALRSLVGDPTEAPQRAEITALNLSGRVVAANTPSP